MIAIHFGVPLSQETPSGRCRYVLWFISASGLCLQCRIRDIPDACNMVLDSWPLAPPARLATYVGCEGIWGYDASLGTLQWNIRGNSLDL